MLIRVQHLYTYDMFITIPIIIAIIFFVTTSVVGFACSGAITTLKEYAVGRKTFSVLALAYTILSTSHGGGYVWTSIKQIYEDGLYYIILLIFWAIFTKVAIICLARCMSGYMDHCSIAETIGFAYGKWPRVIAALFASASLIFMLAIQINAIVKTCHICIPINVGHDVLALATVLMTILYTTFGGVISVTVTDILQGLTFMLLIPYLAYFIYNSVNQSPVAIYTTLASYEKFHVGSLVHNKGRLVEMMLLGLTGIVGSVNPTLLQRVYMSSGPRQAARAFWMATVIDLVLIGFIVSIGILIFVYSPNAYNTEAILYDILKDSRIVLSLFGICMLSLTISTADSILNTCSVFMVHDVICPLYGKPISHAKSLLWVRTNASTIGVIATAIAWVQEDLFRLLLMGSGFLMPVVSAPLLFAIFGLKISTRSVLIGMAVGFVVALVFVKYLDFGNAFCPILAMLANAVTMLIGRSARL